MAKTLYEINLGLNDAKKQAEELETIAENLEYLMNNEWENHKSSIQMNWKSESTAQYMEKVQNVGTSIKTIATNLRTTAGTIRTIAQNIYKAEKKALETIKQKK